MTTCYLTRSIARLTSTAVGLSGEFRIWIYMYVICLHQCYSPWYNSYTLLFGSGEHSRGCILQSSQMRLLAHLFEVLGPTTICGRILSSLRQKDEGSSSLEHCEAHYSASMIRVCGRNISV